MKIYIRNIFRNNKKVEYEKKNKVKEKGSLNFINDNICNNHDLNIINLKSFFSLDKKDKVIKELDEKQENKVDEIKYYSRKGAANGKNKIIKLNNHTKSNNINTNTKNNKEDTKNNESKGKFKFNKYNLPKSYYALLIFMILLAGLSINMVIQSNESLLEENYAVFNNQGNSFNLENEVEDKEADNNNELQNIDSSNIDTRSNLESNSSSVNSSIVTKVQEKVNNIVEKKEEPLVFVKPLNGEISKIFSNDKVIYSKTLDMWKTHDGIDIKGNIGDIVNTIEKGTVEKVYDDAFYGITIVINHGQGYKSSYSNLSEDTFVNVGDKVKKSQKIGKIGTTSIGEIKDVSHLHFMLYENEKIADPSSIFE